MYGSDGSGSPMQSAISRRALLRATGVIGLGGLAGSLAACSSSNSADGTTSSNSPASGTSSSSASAPAVAPSAVSSGTASGTSAGQVNQAAGKLTILVPSLYPLGQLNKLSTYTPADEKRIGQDTHKLFTLLQSWKKQNPNVTLDITEVAPADIASKVILMGQAKTPADVIYVNDLNIPKLASGGYLTALDSFPGDWSDYSQAVIHGIASHDGKIYAMPTLTDCRMVFYWKADFVKAGIASSPQTWDEMLVAAGKLKAAGFAVPYAFWSSSSIHTPTQTVLSTVWMQGGDVFDKDGKATLVTDPMRNTFRFYKKVMDQGYSSKDLLTVVDDDAYANYLLKHKASMLHGGSWTWDRVQAAKLDGQIGYFRTPRPTASDKDATLSGFWAFELPTVKDTSRQQLAFQFADHFTNTAAQLAAAKGSAALPLRASVLEDKSLDKTQGPFWKFASAYAVEAGHSMPSGTDDALLFDKLGLAFGQYLSGKGDLDAVLTDAQDSYNNAQ